MPAQPCSRFFQHPAFAWKNKILALTFGVRLLDKRGEYQKIKAIVKMFKVKA
jgi:hypothetical protein